MYWKLIALVVMIALGYNKGYNNGAEAIKAEWTIEKLAIEQEYSSKLEQAISKQEQLNIKIETIQKARINETKNINAKHAATLSLLRQRPAQRSADTSLSTTSPTAIGCTGKELAKPDAEFLAGYAADAAKLNEALQQCKAQYNSLTTQ